MTEPLNTSLMTSLREQGRTSFEYDDLIACSEGKLFGPGNPQLPKPPMLMFHRIKAVSDTGGTYNRGFMVAEFSVSPEDWFFKCHFENDPVMPGCLGVDALWQLLGFYLGWQGGQGRGRALGAGRIRFSNQVLPSNRLIEYRINIKRLIRMRLTLAVADGCLICDGDEIFLVNDIRVGLFKTQPST